MATKTKIQWTDSTFNPWRGCTKISPGCANCYALTLSKRNPKVLGEWGPEGTRVLASDNQWNEPYKWNAQAQRNQKRHKVFCASLADVFESWSGQMMDSQENRLWINPLTNEISSVQDDAHDEELTLHHARERLWDLIRETPWLDWQLLTKRPENICSMMSHGEWKNVWLGTSIENQEYTWRVDALQEVREVIQVPVLFVSAEPLLGPIDFGNTLQGIQWLISGGESGGNARPIYLDWVWSIMYQCQDAKCAFFNKQFGSVAMINDESEWTLEDAKGGDITEFPIDLQVREFPNL